MSRSRIAEATLNCSNVGIITSTNGSSSVEDRDIPGNGFTHKLGDIVTISSPAPGTLRNTARLSTDCPPRTFGNGHLMKNLAVRGYST